MRKTSGSSVSGQRITVEQSAYSIRRMRVCIKYNISKSKTQAKAKHSINPTLCTVTCQWIRNMQFNMMLCNWQFDNVTQRNVTYDRRARTRRTPSRRWARARRWAARTWRASTGVQSLARRTTRPSLHACNTLHYTINLQYILYTRTYAMYEYRLFA